MYVDLLEHLSEVESRLGSESRVFKAVSQAFKEHPNLRAYVDHVGVTRLCSSDVNGVVDTIDITHRTEDTGSLVIFPYIQAQGQRIYSDPPIHVIGYRNPDGFGEIPLPDWEEGLKQAGLGQDIVRKVRWYLGAHQPVNYDQVPDEEDSSG